WSVMMRRSVVDRAGRYDLSFPVAQDYDLWMRMARIAHVANLPELLVIRRLPPGRISAVRNNARLLAEARVRWRAVRSHAYPWWGVVFALRARTALAPPVARPRGAGGARA